MRKIFTYLLICCAASAMAQDLIVTYEAEKIEAKILEVSDVEIKYKKWANQDGPTFVLPTTKINTIIYQNGDVQVFEKILTNAQVKVEEPEIEYVLDRKKYRFYYKGERITRSEYRSIIRQCPIAFEKYSKGYIAHTGGILSLVGTVALCGIGIREMRDNDTIGGYICFSLASILELGSIPCFIVGGIKLGKAYDAYNVQCAHQEPAVSLGIITSQNGIGLALNF